jgi:tetratricopeptide (TPR) repeat protein
MGNLRSFIHFSEYLNTLMDRNNLIMILLLGSILIFFAGCRDDEAEVSFERGKKLYNAQHLEEALECFNLSIAEDKKFKQAYVMAAKCHYYQNREIAALDTLKKVLRLYPDYVDANFWAARVYYFINDYERARQYLYRVLDEDSSHTGARFLLGELLLYEGNLEEAMLNYAFVGEDIDTIALSKIRIAGIYAGSQQYKRALEEMSFIERNREFLNLMIIDEAWKLLAKIPESRVK